MILVDVRNAAAFQRSVCTGVPAVLVVAPPEGDFLAVGTKGSVELEGLLTRLSPGPSSGVGNASLAGELEGVYDPRAGRPLARACVSLGHVRRHTNLRAASHGRN